MKTKKPYSPPTFEKREQLSDVTRARSPSSRVGNCRLPNRFDAKIRGAVKTRSSISCSLFLLLMLCLPCMPISTSMACTSPSRPTARRCWGPCRPPSAPMPRRRAKRAFDLRIRTAEQLPAPAELPEFWRGTLPGGSRIIFRCGQRRRQIEVIDQAMAEVDLSEARAEFVVRPGAEACLMEACVLPWLCDILNDRGHYIIHAASLFLDRPPQRKAVLISGPSGRGKTTAGLGLAGAGLRSAGRRHDVLQPFDATGGRADLGHPSPL